MEHLVNSNYLQVINNLDVVRFYAAEDSLVGMINKKSISHPLYIVILLISN